MPWGAEITCSSVSCSKHPDSINDGSFFNAQNNFEWIDYPGNYHNKACGFAFSDGHSEIHKWRSTIPKLKIRMVDLGRQTIPRTDIDFSWIIQRTSAPR